MEEYYIIGINPCNIIMEYGYSTLLQFLSIRGSVEINNNATWQVEISIDSVFTYQIMNVTSGITLLKAGEKIQLIFQLPM